MYNIRKLFDTKFCQPHFDIIITEYLEESFNAEVENTIFNLSLVKWIKIKEIAFLLAWIRKWFPQDYANSFIELNI